MDEEPPCKVLPAYERPEDDTLSMSLWELLEATGSQVTLDPSHKEATLVLGNTGSGKTTVTQITSGNLSHLGD